MEFMGESDSREIAISQGSLANSIPLTCENEHNIIANSCARATLLQTSIKPLSTKVARCYRITIHGYAVVAWKHPKGSLNGTHGLECTERHCTEQLIAKIVRDNSFASGDLTL
jgi:hypothetical protein